MSILIISYSLDAMLILSLRIRFMWSFKSIVAAIMLHLLRMKHHLEMFPRLFLEVICYLISIYNCINCSLCRGRFFVRHYFALWLWEEKDLAFERERTRNFKRKIIVVCISLALLKLSIISCRYRQGLLIL